MRRRCWLTGRAHSVKNPTSVMGSQEGSKQGSGQAKHSYRPQSSLAVKLSCSQQAQFFRPRLQSGPPQPTESYRLEGDPPPDILPRPLPTKPLPQLAHPLTWSRAPSKGCSGAGMGGKSVMILAGTGNVSKSRENFWPWDVQARQASRARAQACLLITPRMIGLTDNMSFLRDRSMQRIDRR